MFDVNRESPVTDALFGPIDDRDRADDAARLLAIVVLALAVVEGMFALVFGPGAVAVAAIEAALGGLVGWRKSITAAVALLVVALAAAVFVLLGVLRHEEAGRALAFVVALAGVWAGTRAVHCAVASLRLASGVESSGRGKG